MTNWCPPQVPLAKGGQAAPKLPAIIANSVHSTPIGAERGTAGTSESLLSGENDAATKMGVAAAGPNELQRRDPEVAQKLPVRGVAAAESERVVAGSHSSQQKSLGDTGNAGGSKPPMAFKEVQEGSSRGTEERLPSSGRTSLAVRLTDGSFIRCAGLWT